SQGTRVASRPLSTTSPPLLCRFFFQRSPAPRDLHSFPHDALPISGLPVPQADHGLRHRAVTPGAADLAEHAAHHVARGADVAHRSEEHTSELQSRFDLVCRLLLEKKKITQDAARACEIIPSPLLFP